MQFFLELNLVDSIKELKDKQDKLEKLKVNLTIEVGKIGDLEEKILKNKWKIDLLEQNDSKNEDIIKLLNAADLKLEKEIKELKEKFAPKLGAEGATLPSSCTDLENRGQPFNGIYLVKDSSTKKIQSISCDFGASGNFSL